MKKSSSLFILVLLLTLLASSSAWAHNRFGPWHGHGSVGAWPAHGHWHGNHQHGGGHVGVFIGVPLGAPWHYNPYYTYPPVVTVPATPPVYIQQALPLQDQQQSNSWWYYCNAQQGYYPYVKQCPSGWQLVPAQPPDLGPDLR